MAKTKDPIKKLSQAILFAIFFCLFTSKPAFAGFGVSPAEIYNELLKPGAHFEQEIYLSRSDINEDLTVTIDPDLNEMADWFKFIPDKTFKFPKGKNSFSVKAIVDVPKNVPLKKYRGVLRIKASSGESDTPMGVSVVKGARMDINFITTQINISQLLIRELNLSNATTEDDGKISLNLKAKIENSGNTAAAPSKITLDIADLQQKHIITLENNGHLDTIEPNETKEIEAKFDTVLGGGEYFANISVYFKEKIIRQERLVFKIIGAAKDIEYQQQQDEKGKLSQFKVDLKFMNIKTIIALSVVGIVLLILTILSYKAKQKKVIYIIVSILLLISLLASFSLINLNSKFKSQEKLINKTNDQGSVKGDSINTQSSPVPTQKIQNKSPLLIQGSKNGKYYIYQFPDLNSKKIYTADEDQKFKVVEEKDGWYRVSISSTIGGWLEKESVKNEN